MSRNFQSCTYILASTYRGTLYVGVTSDLAGRLWQHRSGTTSGFTSDHTVYRLVHLEAFDAMDAAINREMQIKNWHRQWKINLIEETNPQWRDLASDLSFKPLPPRSAGDGS